MDGFSGWRQRNSMRADTLTHPSSAAPPTRLPFPFLSYFLLVVRVLYSLIGLSQFLTRTSRTNRLMPSALIRLDFLGCVDAKWILLFPSASIACDFAFA